MTIDLTWSTAESIAVSLDNARSGLDGTAGSAPSGIDAGEATAVIEALLARVGESAAGLGEGVAAASGKVRMSAASLLDVDLGVQQGFQVGEP